MARAESCTGGLIAARVTIGPVGLPIS
ncbi:hypothetical protein [Rhodococcoides kroppenstedtii]|nr:hypothetical protein [Rhodococcus kroppenstedtii]